MKKIILSLCVSAACIAAIIYDAQAGMIDYNRRNKAGAPKAGGYRAKPDVKPTAQPPAAPAAAVEQVEPMWMKTPPVVITAVEKVYDINRDGKLQPAEVKIYLRSVIEEIDAKGGVTINSDILKEYDKNRDGVISRYELPELKRDAQS